MAIAALAAMTAAACASVPMASPRADARAKQFQPAPGTALLYVYRNETLGSGVKMDLLLNGRLIGQTARKTYVLATLQPGFHRLDSVASSTSTLKLSANPGRIYYVWQEVTWGLLYAGSRLQLVDEQTGQAGVRECKLAD